MKKTIGTFLLCLLSLTLLAQQGTQNLIFNLNGQTVRGKVRRDLAVYPLTVAGFAKLKADVESATRPLSVSVLNANGSLARILPPIVTTPPPSGTAAVGPNWIAARYTQGTTLSVRGKSSAAVLFKIERVDGLTTPALSNISNPVLNWNQFYPSGIVSSTDGYTQDWTLGPVPNVPVRMTFRQSGQTDYAIVRTPVVTSSPIQLFTSGTATTPPSVTTTPPPTNTTVTPASFLSYQNQARAPGEQYRFIENDSVKVGVEWEVGMVIGWISLKHGPRAGQNLVNGVVVVKKPYNQPAGSPVTYVTDKGRSIQFGSDYWSWLKNGQPEGNGYIINGKNTATNPSGTGDPAGNDYGQYPNPGFRNPYIFDTGGNTVQGGSMIPYLDESPVLKSAIVQTGDRGPVICAQVRPVIWGVRSEIGPIIIDEEIWLVGNTTAIGYKAGHTVLNDILTNSAAPVAYSSREQENPCAYVLAPFTSHYAVFGTPFVGGGTSNVPIDGGGPFSRTMLTSECWMGSFEGEGTGVALYSPINSAFRIGHFGANSGTATDDASDYVNSSYQFNYSNPGFYVDYGYILPGTLAQVRAKVRNTLPRPDQSLSFDFSTDNHRFFNSNCKGIKQAGYYEYTIGQTNADGGHFAQISSPTRAWDASGISQVQFDMAVSGSVTRLWFEWQGPGDYDRDDPYQESHRFAIDVTPDGVRRTYTVPTSGRNNWNGVINRFGLKAIRNGYGEPETPIGSLIKMYRVGKNL